MFLPAGVVGLLAAEDVEAGDSKSLISACTLVVKPLGLRECVTVFIVQLLFMAAGNPVSVIKPSAMMSGRPLSERVIDSLPRSPG